MTKFRLSCSATKLQALTASICLQWGVAVCCGSFSQRGGRTTRNMAFSVKERCLAQQKKRRQRAAKKICVFIGSFVLCFSPYVITRLVELLPCVHIPQYWGIATKCLCYAKASSDPFVYCLLRHQYRKVLVRLVSRFLRKEGYLLSASTWSSTFDTTEENCARTT